MQLFSIGLIELNTDGSPKLTEEGYVTPTYNTDQIEAFARVWTGLTRENSRGNRENPTYNYLDPAAIKYDYHDFLPKVSLHGGHLGDGYLLCADHPRAFLAKGARYRYTGDSSAEGVQFDSHWATANRPRFNPSSKSALFKALCKRDSKTGRCTFPSDVVLPDTLPCLGAQECGAEHVKVVKIVDGKDVGYFTHLPPPCARLAFFNGVMTYQPERYAQTGPPQCTDPTSPVIAAPACCETKTDELYKGWGENKCLFSGETVTLKTAQARCAEAHPDGVAMQVCPTNKFSKHYRGREIACADTGYIWTTESCKLRVKVFSSGKVSIVTPGDIGGRKYGNKHGLAKFVVHWDPLASGKGNLFPSVEAGCGAGCTIDKAQGGSCLCDVTVTQHAPFTDVKKIPKAEELVSKLFVGAPAPANEPGVYTLCKSCAQPVGVKVYIRGNNASPAKLDETAVFAIENGQGKTLVYLMNLRSTVGVGIKDDAKGFPFSFRNPPNLMPGVGEEYPHVAGWDRIKFRTEMVAHEIDAMIDHVFYHGNTAVFVARKLIMRLVNSNPSPRYIKTCLLYTSPSPRD